MAKTMSGVEGIIQLRRTKDGTWEQRGCGFGPPKDDTDADITYANKFNSGGPVALTKAQLDGTLRAYLAARDIAYETANGIA